MLREKKGGLFMVREIIHDPILLAGKSSPAGPEGLRQYRIMGQGFSARILQHEIDHIHGVRI